MWIHRERSNSSASFLGVGPEKSVRSRRVLYFRGGTAKTYPSGTLGPCTMSRPLRRLRAVSVGAAESAVVGGTCTARGGVE